VSTWDKLGGVAPRDLSETRLQLHWASQLVAAVGSSLVPAKPDDSHTALTYDVERSLLVSAETETSPSRRVALSVPDFRLVLLDNELRELAGWTLDGKTLPQGLDWLGVELSASPLSVPDYDMPHHAIRDGAAFRREQPEAFNELALWFKNTARVLRSLKIGDDLCWPHHFDLAAVITLGGDKTIGVGLSPGDSSYDEPYWYVAPSPHPTDDDLLKLPMGHWHTEGFVAAILTGSDITAKGDPAAQAAKVDAFLSATISGSRKLLQ
jgi:hypothetical protein